MIATIIIIAWGIWVCWELDRERVYCQLFVFYDGDENKLYIAAPTNRKAIRFMAKMLCETRKSIRRGYTVEMVPRHEWFGLTIEYLQFGKYPAITNAWEEMYHGRRKETALIATNIVD
jgi:hypothetical protein